MYAVLVLLGDSESSPKRTLAVLLESVHSLFLGLPLDWSGNHWAAQERLACLEGAMTADTGPL